jgi:hypothetical protein
VTIQQLQETPISPIIEKVAESFTSGFLEERDHINDSGLQKSHAHLKEGNPYRKE